MSTGTERREARRFTMTLPLQVLSGEASALRTQTRDVSYRGLYFFAEKPFHAGNEIEFVITLPQDVTGGDVQIRCQGEIVRVDPGENGRVGVAAKIAHYEFIPTNNIPVA